MTEDLESRIRKTGLWLYQLIEGEKPAVFKKEYWMGKVLEWCMKDEAFKTELFRFIDVFPCLKRPESIAQHLTEYFGRPEQEFPTALQWGLHFVSPKSIVTKIVAKGIAKNIEITGRQFIAGATPREAIPVWEELRSQGITFTADLLGEAVVSEIEAEEYLNRYLELFQILKEARKGWNAIESEGTDLDWGAVPKINVSIKPSTTYSQMNARAFDYSVSQAKERLRQIFRRAMAEGAHITLDMEQYALKNLTCSIYRSLMEEQEFTGYHHTGIVIQSYLRDSEQDLNDFLKWAGKRKQRFSIRLVKGAYWDSEVVWAGQKNWPIPVFTNKHETDANFEKLARRIMENHHLVHFACATHNIRSIAYVVEMAKELKVPRECLEFQILYGMAEPVRSALKKAGYPIRLYTPVGGMIPGMAYLVRRLLENTSNESFLRQSFAEGVSREKLLRNPLEFKSAETFISDAANESASSENRGPFRNEPCWDWNLSVHRENFSNALKKMKKEFPFRVPLIINGEKVTTGEEVYSKNPNANEEIVGIVTMAGEAEAQKAIAAARAAFPGWRDISPAGRAEYLFQAAAKARKMRYELAALQVYEVGKNWSEADADVCEAIDFLEYYGREMIRLANPRRTAEVSGEVSDIFYEPRGVAAVIAPWNFPFAISAGMVSAALVAGNSVVYKPSSQSCVTGSMVHKIFSEVKLPRGVLNFIPGQGDQVGDLLITHPDMALIAFTGSKEVGMRIIQLAGKTNEGSTHIKKVIVELGGKNAIIVDSDADLDEAVGEIVQSAFGYQGQKCSACSRLIVLEENYDNVIQRLKAAVESIEIGPPEDPKNFMGAVISARARNKILQYIEIGTKEGKTFLKRNFSNSGGHFTPLTIFTEVQSRSRVAQEEIFGPVLAIIKVSNFDEALEIANSTAYALTGGLFSRSPQNIVRARKEFRVGNLYINRGCTGALVERHPFGGFKLSGVGSKAGGPDYLLQFMVPRNVSEYTLRRGFAPSEDLK